MPAAARCCWERNICLVLYTLDRIASSVAYTRCALRAPTGRPNNKRAKEKERESDWSRLPDQVQVCAHRKCLQMCQVQCAYLELCRWSQRNQNNSSSSSGSNSTSSQELKGHLTASQTPFACKCRCCRCHCNCKWHDSRRRAAMAAGKWTCLVANEIRSVQR